MSDSRYRHYNPNPSKRTTIDCTIRAICKATGKSWREVHLLTFIYSHYMDDMQLANRVWGRYLKENGFRQHFIDDDVLDYTVYDFCVDHPIGTYILAVKDHVVCVQDGFYYDSWDSGQEIPMYYWARGDDP